VRAIIPGPLEEVGRRGALDLGDARALGWGVLKLHDPVGGGKVKGVGGA